MSLNFKHLHEVSDELRDLFNEAYEVSFYGAGRVRVHLHWDSFRALTEHKAETPVECTEVQDCLHCATKIEGVEVVACVFKEEVLQMLHEHLGSNYEYYEVHEDDDILALFSTWQNASGWNMEVNE